MYKDLFYYITDYLKSHGGEDDDRFAFRKRSGHIWRVFTWVQRLTADCTEDIDRDALLIAALFHDIGYSESVKDHTNQGALLFHEYANKHHFDQKQSGLIEYLIRNHSDKELLFSTDTLELVYLLEADMLDETGALGIVWDTMMTGFRQDEDYMEAYRLLKSHTCNKLNDNPMRTPKAREIWENKQELVKEFMKHLEYDLAINEWVREGM